MISHEELKALGVEWVNPSTDGRRPGYFRKIPRTRQEPSIRQAEHRLLFSQTAHKTFGERGVIRTPDDRQIPQNANIIANKLQGSGRPEPKPTMTQKLFRLILEA